MDLSCDSSWLSASRLRKKSSVTGCPHLHRKKPRLFFRCRAPLFPLKSAKSISSGFLRGNLHFRSGHLLKADWEGFSVCFSLSPSRPGSAAASTPAAAAVNRPARRIQARTWRADPLLTLLACFAGSMLGASRTAGQRPARLRSKINFRTASPTSVRRS